MKTKFWTFQNWAVLSELIRFDCFIIIYLYKFWHGDKIKWKIYLKMQFILILLVMNLFCS